jgi:hypothetical protein
MLMQVVCIVTYALLAVGLSCSREDKIRDVIKQNLKSHRIDWTDYMYM